MSKDILQPLHLNLQPNSDLETLEGIGTSLAEWQRGCNWWIGDLAKYAASRCPETYHQVFPEWTSPGLVERCRAVSIAYSPEDRNPAATWVTHMRHANRPDRLERVQAAVDAGRTSDEDRAATAAANANGGPRWLLAIDVHYFLHRFWFSGAGVESAVGVSQWIQRTTARLKEKGLTDVLCCFDSFRNDRKKLTEGWEHTYKDRPPKDPELGQQLTLVRELLEGHGFCCASVDGSEADDLMSTAAKQFEGKVTLLSQDKDVRQCLSSKCNILLDVEWNEDDTSGEATAEYKWLSAKQHFEATGVQPAQWADFQAIMGDNVDGIKGAVGIGKKGAADLIVAFGTAAAAIDAAKREDDRIKPKQRQSLIDFEPQLDVTRQLVTLNDSLPLPGNTRI